MSNNEIRGGTQLFSASIIIPVFNNWKYTGKCLESLYALTEPELRYEVIVVDNASTDGTAEQLAQASTLYPHLRAIRNSENLRFAHACNQGARAAQGEVLVFLNNDTEVTPGWLAAGLDRLRSDRKMGIVGAKLLYPDRSIQHCGIQFVKVRSEDVVWPEHRYRFASEDDPCVNIPEEVEAVTGACLFIRADVFRSVGGFEEKYGMYFEDTDLCFAVRKLGRKIFYEPKCVVIHHEGKSTPTRAALDELNQFASKVFYARWKDEVHKLDFEASIVKREGRYRYFSENVWPTEASDFTMKKFARLMQDVPESYVHVGGAGDALLLLSTFYDKQPKTPILCVANSTEVMKSFFDAFPLSREVYFIPFPKDPPIHVLARHVFLHLSNFLGAGATPSSDLGYNGEWVKGIDIFTKYKIKTNPKWARAFRGNKSEHFQVTIQPKGSLKGMVGSKRNAIDPASWNDLLQFFEYLNIRPLILGTPDEAELYPAVHGAIDRRSYSFEQQFRLIASSDVFVGADSWGKTFSALAGVKTFVFHATRGEDLKDWVDVADHVFLHPWKEITVVESIAEFQSAFSEHLQKKPLSICMEGPDALDDVVGLINRELRAQIRRKGHELPAASTENDRTLPRVDIHIQHQRELNATAPAEGRWVVMVPEGTDRIDREQINDIVDRVDEVWAPNSFVHSICVEDGIPADSVATIHPGVNAKLFSPGAKPYRIPTARRFKFVALATDVHRQGTDIVVEAYSRMFKRQDDVCLILIGPGERSDEATRQFKARIAEIALLADAAEIVCIDAALSDRDLAGVLASCNVLLYPYRDDGSGVHILQAMASGLPVVVTEEGASMDFCRNEYAFYVAARRIAHSFQTDGTSDRKLNPAFFEPSVEDVAKHMRFAIENQEAMKQRGRTASAAARGSFSWEVAFEKIEQRCQALRIRRMRRSLSEDDPRLFKEMLNGILVHMNAGRLDAASERLHVLEMKYEKSPATNIDFEEKFFLLKGSIALRREDLNEAKKWYEKALTVQPASSAACAALGDVFDLGGMSAEAKPFFEWAVRLDPNNAAAIDGLAKTIKKLGLSDDHTEGRSIQAKPNSGQRLRLGSMFSAAPSAPVRPEPRTVILQRTFGLGDVLMALPAARSIKKLHPSTEVVFVTNAHNVPLVQACPWVDRVVTEKPPQAEGSMYHNLDPARFGTSSLPEVDAFIAEVGVRADDQDKTIDLTISSEITSETERKVTGVVGSDWQRALDGTAKVILMHAASGDPNRTWPAKRWNELADRFVRMGHIVIAIGSTTSDASRGVHMITTSGVRSLVNKLSLLETVALCRMADVLVSTDSGPIQLAAASDIGIVGIYSVVRGYQRLPYRHGVSMWNAKAVEPICEFAGCYAQMKEERFTRNIQERISKGLTTIPKVFSEWCVRNESYACMRSEITTSQVPQACEEILASRSQLVQASAGIVQ